ncbi:MAG: TIGR00296 family protein [Aquificae bacterium]|nr:TIGR00296 family protein [Aquificota bacterium]
MDVKDAKKLIELGRKAVWEAFRGGKLEVPQEIKEAYSQPMGVFTTIERYPQRQLRGCIGVPLPVYPLWYGVIHSSLQAAFNDPRFPPLSPEEFDKVTWELSLLTPPEEIKAPPEERPKHVEVGKHGLIVERGNQSGLLLPQVAVEHRWNPVEFLEYTCLKAGLPRDCWRDPSTKVYRFSGEVFREVEPFGEVVREELGQSAT